MDLHEAIIELSGGRHGVLRPHVVDAAIHRPKTYLSYHEDCTIHTVCAVLLDSIARNHGFADANKRTGLMTAILTYELNGVALNLRAAGTQFEDLVLWVVNDRPEIEVIAKKLESLVKKYKKRNISDMATKLRNLIKPFDTEI